MMFLSQRDWSVDTRSVPAWCPWRTTVAPSFVREEKARDVRSRGRQWRATCAGSTLVDASTDGHFRRADNPPTHSSNMTLLKNYPRSYKSVTFCNRCATRASHLHLPELTGDRPVSDWSSRENSWKLFLVIYWRIKFLLELTRAYTGNFSIIVDISFS